MQAVGNGVGGSAEVGLPRRATMSDLVGQELGQYQLRQLIRRGGMSTVYKGFQPSLERWVAVKVLTHPGDPTFLSRFRLEARSIARLQHPNIVPIHDYGEADGQVYLVVAYVDDGRSLADEVGTPMALGRALELGALLLAGLGYAHERGLVHRDVKPANVLLPTPNWPMLADFGIAKLLLGGGAGLTQAGLVVGTPVYMAPEQAFGLPVDPRTDLYAVGLVLYEMLTGRVPFEADTPSAALMKQAYEPPPPPRTLNPELPVEVEHVLLKALAKDPGDRYQDAEAMARAIRAVSGELPARVAPPAKAPAEEAPATGGPVGEASIKEASTKAAAGGGAAGGGAAGGGAAGGMAPVEPAGGPATDPYAAAYAAGVAAYSSGRWDEAIERLTALAEADLDYEDVEELLESAHAARDRERRSRPRQVPAPDGARAGAGDQAAAGATKPSGVVGGAAGAGGPGGSAPAGASRVPSSPPEPVRAAPPEPVRAAPPEPVRAAPPEPVRAAPAVETRPVPGAPTVGGQPSGKPVTTPPSAARAPAEARPPGQAVSGGSWADGRGQAGGRQAGAGTAAPRQPDPATSDDEPTSRLRGWLLPGVAAVLGVIALVFLGLSLSRDRNGTTAPPETTAAARTTTTAPTAPTAPAKPQAWKAVTSGPLALESSGTAAFKGRVWVAGGFDENRRGRNDVVVYDPATRKWSNGPALPQSLTHAALVATDKDLLLIGGYRGSTIEPITTVRRLDLATSRWVRGPSLPVALGAGTAAWDGKRVVFAGGVAANGEPSAAVFALEGRSWRQIGSLTKAREHLAAASDGAGTTFFLVGEVNDSRGKTVLADVDVVTGRTVRRLGTVRRPRGSVAGFWSPAAGACVAGGRDGSRRLFADVECIDAKGTVTRLASLSKARHGLGVAVVDGTAYALLGAGPENLKVGEALPLES